MTATDDDLMDASKFYVEPIHLSTDQDDSKKKKQSAKRKRARHTEQVEKEKRIREKGLEKLRTIEYEEYSNLCERFKSGDVFQFEEFLDMINRMRKPLVCQIEGHEVSLTQDDCAIMMEASTVRAITDSLFIDREKQNVQQEQQNKRQRNGNQTVRTECGATGTVALYQTAQCNSREKKQAIKKAKDKLDRESKNISTTLTSLSALKRKKPDGYWLFSPQSSQQELSMLLRLLAPESGMISKGKQLMWGYIEAKNVPMLFQAAVDAKAEEYSHCLAVLAEDLAALQEQEQELKNSPDAVEDEPDSTAEDAMDETSTPDAGPPAGI